jgi:flagellar hook-associated protein FlgK
MGNTSTFGTFTMARLGIFVAQHALNVTGNNISNINTEGYTREKLDQSSMYFGGADRYQSKYDIRENGGVLANGVDQIRDQYLDIRYRNEMTKVGAADAKLDGLKQLDAILDEVAKGEDGEGVLEARFNDFLQQLQELSKDQNAGNDDIDALVRSSAEALAVQFNTYAGRLETLKENVTAQFKQELDETNTTLEKIRDLNETIRKTQIFGGTGLTLKDERNLLIDDLSKKIGINVIYEMENLGDGVEVEKLKITTSGDPSRVLIDGIYGAQLSIVQEGDDVPRKDKAGNPVLDEDGRQVYDKKNIDNDNFDLAISELVDKRGKSDPADPNKLEQVIDKFAVKLTKEGATGFETYEEAFKAAELLNSDPAYYTNPNDPDKAYYYHVGDATDQDGAASGAKGPFYIHQHDTKMGTDGKPVAYDSAKTPEQNAAAGYVVNPFRYTEVSAPMVTKLKDTELSGGLQAMREMLTESGEYATAYEPEDLRYDPEAGTKRGIPYYQKALDTLANVFAEKLNNANTLVGTSPVADFDDKTMFETNKDGLLQGKDNMLYKLNGDGETYTKLAADGTTVENASVAAADARANFVLKDDYKKYYKQNDEGKFVDYKGDVLADQTDPTKYVPNIYVDKATLYQQDSDGNFLGADGHALSEAELKDPTQYVLKDGFEKYFRKNSEGNFERDPLTKELILKEGYQKFQGGALFSNSGNTDDTTNITAANISVSNSWAHGMTHVLRSKDSDADTQSRLQDNIRHIITVMGSKHEFKTGNEETSMNFEGTFQQMLTEVIAGTLAKDENITETMLNNYNTTADEIYVDRDAVMGVDLNDEAMNMMQYQKAYSAACRLMTTYDAMLEKLINGTAI